MKEQVVTLALKEYMPPDCTCAVERLRQSADVLKGTITRLNLETRESIRITDEALGMRRDFLAS